jgi:hypothetical protein
MFVPGRRGGMGRGGGFAAACLCDLHPLAPSSSRARSIAARGRGSGDQLLKGAALNAVQIGERMLGLN